LTEADFNRLSALTRALKEGRRPERAVALEERLRDPLFLEDERPAEGYVSMQSTVTIRDSATDESFTYRLVFPAEADIASGRISVLSPLGAALLGRRCGESFSYASPGGPRQVSVDRVSHEA